MAQRMRSSMVRRPAGIVAAFVWLLASTACVVAASAVSPVPEASWTVTEVLDGDTIRVSANGIEETVRLVGVNTSEHGECWSDEATEVLRSLLGTGPVGLERDVSDRDQYGRFLRYVTTPTGEDAGGLLIDAGAAIARSYPPDVARDADYRQRQATASEAGLGLWARDACGSGAWASIDPASIGIDVHEDAAGDDSLNLNDEWVRFTYLGSQPLDLGGWMVKDESSSHRYRFVDLVLEPGASVTLRSGCGADTGTERYWCVNGSAIWNNSGDTVFLLDPAGNVVAQLGYPVPIASPGP